MTQPAPPLPPIPFTPVATRPRADGWSPLCQQRFIAALAVMGTVPAACRAVGKSGASAYKLRARPDAASFAAAWDAALDEGRARAFELAMDRAVNGVETPRYYQGRFVGTRRRFDYRLALAALTPRRLPRRAANAAPAMTAPQSVAAFEAAMAAIDDAAAADAAASGPVAPVGKATNTPPHR